MNKSILRKQVTQTSDVGDYEQNQVEPKTALESTCTSLRMNLDLSGCFCQLRKMHAQRLTTPLPHPPRTH